MADWQRTTFGALGQLFDGPHATPTRRDHGPYFLNISSLKAGRLDLSESDHLSNEDFAFWTRRVTPRKDDLLFSYETRLGEAALMPDGIEACLGRRMALLRPDTRVVDPRFLVYYYLSPSFQDLIAKYTIHGATVTRIGLATMPNWEVTLPPLRDQKAIAEVLGALDDKIALNDRVIRCTLELSNATFTRAVESESRLANLDELATFHNRQRIPLSSRERDARTGTVPYYGAAGLLDYVDEALFDERLVLVGEDGSVVRDNGTPVVQYIWGPAWVNNHAHVLTGAGISTEALRTALTRSKVTHLVTGAVQPKISMGNLKRLQLRIPMQMGPLDSKMQAFAALERAVVAESSTLARTRDELLPLLMSNKLSVTGAEEVAEGVA